MFFQKNNLVNVIQKVCFSLPTDFKDIMRKSSLIPSRSFFSKWKTKDPEKVNRSEDDILSRPFFGYDDPYFTERLLLRLRDPEAAITGGKVLIKECKKFLDEKVTMVKTYGDFDIRSKINRVEMLFIFDTEEDVRKFTVNTDSSFMVGYSSASLKLTSRKTALFSGNICTEIPKDGNIKASGFANILSLTRRKSFLRVNPYNWKDYTHLVFKIRGDGRTYLIILTTPGDSAETSTFCCIHPLYTRGGPYWQIAKVPLSHFILSRKTDVAPNQAGQKFIFPIQKLGITAAHSDGPFKLEIEYIGLEHDPYHNTTNPYESYH